MESITYKLVQSARKSIALHIREGRLEVRAPFGAPRKEIERFIASKRDWIVESLDFSKQLAELQEGFSLNYGDNLRYLGKKYSITAREGDLIGFDGSFFMPPDLSPDGVMDACVGIYKMLAKRVLTKKVDEFAKIMNVEPTAVKITSAKKRWGSCSWRNGLNFSWRLIMAHEELVDYVVVHELAHLIEMNHGKRFWRIVEEIVPDHKNVRRRLKVLYIDLVLEGW